MMVDNPLCKIRTIYRAIGEFEDRLVRDYGLCLNEGMVLCFISEKGTASSSEIASALDLTCSNASKVIKSVESKQLIQRSLDETDKRMMLFSLTKEGKQKLKELMVCDVGSLSQLNELF
jgi:DNA-binding MarR family transcriptional regulator